MLIVWPSLLETKLRPRLAGPPPAMPKGATVRLSDSIATVRGRMNSSCEQQGLSERKQICASADKTWVIETVVAAHLNQSWFSHTRAIKHIAWRVITK